MTVYINGREATKADKEYLRKLFEQKRIEIISINTTKLGNLAIKTN